LRWMGPAQAVRVVSMIQYVGIRASAGRAPRGALFLPKADGSGMTRVEFTVETEAPKDQGIAREQFLRAKAQCCQRLWGMGIPGGAWFRRMAAECAAASEPASSLKAADAEAAREAEQEAAKVKEEDAKIEALAAKTKGKQEEAAKARERGRAADEAAKAAEGAADAKEKAAAAVMARRAARDAQLAALRAQSEEQQARQAATQRRMAAAQRAEARMLEADRPATAMDARGRPRQGQWQDTYSLFTGARALSENLQLDRELRAGPAGEDKVDVGSIAGIDTTPIDWKPLVAGLSPRKDPLAALIPDDQHAVFFPTFQAMLDLMDEAEARGAPVYYLFNPRSEDARTAERYRKQLCLPATELSRILGPKMISSVAFTGSDPFLQSGSDVAVLFEAVNAAALAAALAVNQAAAQSQGARAVKGDVSGVAYQGVVSSDRSVCSYMAAVGKAVVVANSLAQLGRVVAVSKGETPALGSLEEYTFFRDRYRLGEDETALVVVSDATLRRWCGPRWRIADSRRTRAAAALAGVQAQMMEKLAAGQAPALAAGEGKAVFGEGDLAVGAGGVLSKTWGTLEFLTPISEMKMDKVTEEEAQEYGRFRERYQRNWREVFDPIAIRFVLKGERVAADLTVRPLIVGSEYRSFMEVTGKGAVEAESGDPHEGTLLHYVMALDRESRPVRDVTGFAMRMAPGAKDGLLNWLGGWAGIYADADPFWADLAQAAKEGERGMEKMMERRFTDLPLGLVVDVQDPLKLAVFLTMARAFVDRSAPGATAWENLEHAGGAYVKVSQPQRAERRGRDDAMSRLAIYYIPGPETLTLSLNEGVIKRALERAAERRKPAAEGQTAPRASQAWLGKSAAVRARPEALTMLQAVWREDIALRMQRASWSNLPILNEWRRLGAADPVALHERAWRVRLVCPGGGNYVWNDEWQTFESTVFGCPGQPKQPEQWPGLLGDLTGAALGLTFEGDGLRARAELERKAGKP